MASKHTYQPLDGEINTTRRSRRMGRREAKGVWPPFKINSWSRYGSKSGSMVAAVVEDAAAAAAGREEEEEEEEEDEADDEEEEEAA
jgi:hypothetical protein